MKLLILEDNQQQQQAFQKFFKKIKQPYQLATSYKEGLRQIISHEYDCIIISKNLAGGTNLKLLEYLTENQSQTGIIIISSTNVLEERLLAFEKGADDYLYTPFDLRELYARLKAVVKRRLYQSNNTLKLNDLSIDIEARQLTINQKQIPLTKKEFDILLYLARNKNRVISKDAIIDYTWDSNMENTASFDFIYAHIKNLRKKLAQNDCEEYLQTIYGVGYKFVVK